MIGLSALPSLSLFDEKASIDTACPPNASWVCRPVYEAFGPVWAQWAEWMVSKPLTILLVLVIAFIINRIARFVIRRSLNRLLQPPSERAVRARRLLRRAAPSALLRTSSINLRLDARVQTLTTVFRSIASVLIWFVAGMTILQIVGVNVTSLAIISSVAGVAVGFGAQHIVRDFLAGMFIVLEDQFGVGDTVDIGNGAKGTVEELTLRTTRVRDVNGTLWHVPNGTIARVANKSQEWARAVLDVEVDGGTPYHVVGPLIEHVAETMSAEEPWMHDMLESPEVWGVESFTEAGYTVRLVIKTRPASQFRVMRELRIRLLDAFAEAGIVLPGTHWSIEHPGDAVVPAASANGAIADASAAAAEAPASARPAPRRRGGGGRGRPSINQVGDAGPEEPASEHGPALAPPAHPLEDT